MIERWKPVLGYEDFYQVSDRGRVRRIAGTFGAPAGRILRLQDENYLWVWLHANGHRRRQKIHILVAQAFLGPRPVGLDVNHKNGIKRDNRPVNLEYTTRSENLKHSFRVLDREAVRGEDHGQAKLTDAAVEQIRQDYAAGGVTHRELAVQYGVTYGSIGPILRGETWTHVA